ncbi:polymorphic toxin-type HINT domain-containing protein [Cysteiniphilum sp. QT6929]|uniref:polymorphic toxin-type HINT domain-containing protein n=1 Tax=Cysteiniphilum sp. QT6929 TaxID=2975055 RepID=UPI0024B3478B|nr:polymorphic toxin-type HINT domain-containing protein [Cysteiniphilum sp. QT6929]WHN65307.1 HINT domain-containing protein [Cysteiniphilum sp. QT6929]
MSFAASSQVTNYDLMSITPKTWQQVTLNYTDLIDGQFYPAEIKLLRPIKWLEENGIDQVGKRSTFSLPEFGIDQVEVTVTDITDTKVDTQDTDWRKEKTKTVIGTFKRYAQDVRTYTFIDDKGNIEQINATPNHPFYVANQQAYVAIEDITINDSLISQSGKLLQLICSGEQISSCGRSYYQGDHPIIVYNFEVQLDHVYYVGKNKVLAHNACVPPEYEFLGYHGTNLKNAQSIVDSGPSIKRIGSSAGTDGGEGFYIAKDYRLANDFAENASHKMTTKKTQFGPVDTAVRRDGDEGKAVVLMIYGKRTQTYDFNVMNQSHSWQLKMFSPELSPFDLQMVVKPNQFQYIKAEIYTPSNSKHQLPLWRPHESPF